MSSLLNHTQRELRAAGLCDSDSDYGGMLAEAVLALVRVFDEQGHSGFSANQVIKIFSRVAAYEPLCPLTGADDEWMEVSEGMEQNLRCSHVFRENGQAYNSTGKVFRESSGASFTSIDSRVPVKFPYTPKTQYVNVPDGARGTEQ